MGSLKTPSKASAKLSRPVGEKLRTSQKLKDQETLTKASLPTTDSVNPSAAASFNSDLAPPTQTLAQGLVPNKLIPNHNLPTHEQIKGKGRVQGRELYMWNRKAVAEKVLLNLIYECDKKGIKLPLDETAHRIQPNLTGNAVEQYFNRLRQRHIREGRVVPPAWKKKTAVDVTIRGFIKDDTNGDSSALRPVLYSEQIDEKDCFPAGEDREALYVNPALDLKKEDHKAHEQEDECLIKEMYQKPQAHVVQSSVLQGSPNDPNYCFQAPYTHVNPQQLHNHSYIMPMASYNTMPMSNPYQQEMYTASAYNPSLNSFPFGSPQIGLSHRDSSSARTFPPQYSSLFAGFPVVNQGAGYSDDNHFGDDGAMAEEDDPDVRSFLKLD